MGHSLSQERCCTVAPAHLDVRWATRGKGPASFTLVASLGDSHFVVSSDPSLPSLLTHQKQKGGSFQAQPSICVPCTATLRPHTHPQNHTSPTGKGDFRINLLFTSFVLNKSILMLLLVWGMIFDSPPWPRSLRLLQAKSPPYLTCRGSSCPGPALVSRTFSCPENDIGPP